MTFEELVNGESYLYKDSSGKIEFVRCVSPSFSQTCPTRRLVYFSFKDDQFRLALEEHQTRIKIIPRTRLWSLLYEK